MSCYINKTTLFSRWILFFNYKTIEYDLAVEALNNLLQELK